MKILWVSNHPLFKTGYGTQTAQACTRLSKDHEVSILANAGFAGRVEQWEGMTVFGSGYEKWGYNDVVAGIAKVLEIDQIIVLFDAWTLDVGVFSHLNAACWTPVDHANVPPLVRATLKDSGTKPIAMSQHGQAAFAAVGETVPYVPHGIDTSTFHPYDRAESRKASGLPDDRFVVGMVSTNKGTQPSRKGFSEAFRSFGAFLNVVPDALLYVHSEMFGHAGGVNLEILANHYDIPPDNLFFSEQTSMRYGLPDDAMARLYSSFDVLSFVSYGEGFGIPAVEAQACGCPVISSNFTAQKELNPYGWQVGGRLWFDDFQKADFQIPDDRQMLEALVLAHEARGDQALRDTVCEWAQQYDADLVFEKYWQPTIAQLEADLVSDAPIEVSR